MPLPLSSLALGLASGMRHALEPDHVSAVTQMVTEQRSTQKSVYYAFMWGIGHALILCLVGGLFFFAKREMPENIAIFFEFLVGLMLIGLGIRGLFLTYVYARSDRKYSGRSSLFFGPSMFVHLHPHGLSQTKREQKEQKKDSLSSEKELHIGSAMFKEKKSGLGRFATLPFSVGLMHGLAGSGTVTALLFAHGFGPSPSLEYGESHSSLFGLLYLLVYSTGSIIGMMFVGGLVGAPLAKLTKHPKARVLMLFASALLSLVVGTIWVFQH